MQELTSTDESCPVSHCWLETGFTALTDDGPHPFLGRGRSQEESGIDGSCRIWWFELRAKGRKEKCWLIQDTANLTDPISWDGGFKLADFVPRTPNQTKCLKSIHQQTSTKNISSVKKTKRGQVRFIYSHKYALWSFFPQTLTSGKIVSEWKDTREVSIGTERSERKLSLIWSFRQSSHALTLTLTL